MLDVKLEQQSSKKEQYKQFSKEKEKKRDQEER